MADIMRWLPAEVSDRFQDAVSSLNGLTQAVYGCDLVLADYRGKKGTLSTSQELWDAFAAVEQEVNQLPDGHAKAYLQGMLPAFQMILRVMQGDQVPYAQQIWSMQQVESRVITPGQIELLAQRLDQELYEMGYRQNTVAEKVMTFLADYTLKPEDVVPTTKQFLQRCQQACRDRVLELPDGDGIHEIRGVRNVIYNGNSAYLGNFQGTLSFNIDRPWSLPTFANVLCHEGYPGHHAFYCRWDVLFRQGRLPLEAAYYVKNTPTNCIFEGVPENALHFLGWDDLGDTADQVTPVQKRQFSAGRKILDLQRMYQQNACHFVNLDGMGREDAIAYLMSSGLFQQSEAEGAYRFFTDATRRTYYPCYFYGRWLIGNVYRSFPKERRAELFQLLYDHPHTNATLLHAVEQALGKPLERPFSTEGGVQL